MKGGSNEAFGRHGVANQKAYSLIVFLDLLKKPGKNIPQKVP